MPSELATGSPDEKETPAHAASQPDAASSRPTSGSDAATGSARTRAHGEWGNVFVSGVIAGVVMALAFAKLGAVPAFMVSAGAFGFFVANKNF